MTRLGPYEILSALGAGGMGEVYQARDTKLNRDVALKVLPEAFAADPDRLARFKREAQVLASLNHPHIAAIYGFEDSGSTHALVLELVDGPTLADIIEGHRSKGQGLPIDDALAIATQIADALEAAHEQGIIHRDLKPANIKVRADGMVKVLDFGLAKAMDVGPGGSGGAGGPGGLSMSPTLSIHATQAGIILGTAAYMSPEQAAGKPVDKRSDLWSFGVVLLEMLTGQPVFTGETLSHVLASVLKSDPDWSTLPATTPAALRRLLRRCLEKDRKRRLSDAADARLEIEEALIAPAALDGPRLPTDSRLPARSSTLPWAIAGAAVTAAVVLLMLWSPWRSAPVPATRRLLASIGADASLPTDAGASAILSPDGTMLVFVGQHAGQTRLFIRTLDQLQATPLAGTEGAANPFFSPDGRWIAFFSSRTLKKVSTTGSAVVALCDAGLGRGGTWTDDDTIIFSPSNVLMRVPAGGGTPVVFGAPGAVAISGRWPQALPGGRGVLYTESSTDAANIAVAPLAGGTPKTVVRGAHYGQYVQSGLASPKRGEGGYLIYMQQGELFAVRFDLDRLEPIGQAVPALEGVLDEATNGAAQLAVSSEGTLVYLPGTAASSANPIDWMTRDGKTSVLRAANGAWANPRFSPDGQKLALEISDGKQSDIWVYEWALDTLTQLTFDPGQDRYPSWTPDGRRIVFASDRAKQGITNLYWMNADGSGDVTRLTNSSESHFFPSWHPTGKFLAFNEYRSTSQTDVMILPMEGDATRGWTPGKPTAFLSTPAIKVSPTFSPDGRWLAYFSDDGGRGLDVYVRPFPGPGGTWRITTEGGTYPQWSRTSNELLYTNPQRKVMFVPYTVVGDSFQAGRPQIWSPTGIRGVAVGNSARDVHPDGKRLAVLAAKDEGGIVRDKVVFVSNFFEHLRKIAPGNK